MTAPTAAIATAAIAGALAILKKILPARQKPKPEFITRAEFHHELIALRDRIGAGYLALADKLEACHRDLLASLERQGANFEHRLDLLESALARLDERTHL